MYYTIIIDWNGKRKGIKMMLCQSLQAIAQNTNAERCVKRLSTVQKSTDYYTDMIKKVKLNAFTPGSCFKSDKCFLDRETFFSVWVHASDGR